MKIRLFHHLETHVTIVFMFLFICVFTAIAQDQTEDKSTSNNANIESQMHELKTTLYCFCGCERMTYEICHCGTATRVKKQFRDALIKGKTVEEIRADYLEEHGPRFSAIMPAEGINLLAYFMPVVILIVLGGVVYVVLKRARIDNATLTQPDQPVSDELQQQVEAELEKYKEEN